MTPFWYTGLSKVELGNVKPSWYPGLKNKIVFRIPVLNGWKVKPSLYPKLLETE